MILTDEREIDLVLFSLLMTEDSSQQVLILLLLKFYGVTEINGSSRFKHTRGAPGGRKSVKHLPSARAPVVGLSLSLCPSPPLVLFLFFSLSNKEVKS